MNRTRNMGHGKFLAVVLVAVLLAGCSEFIEPSIEDSKMVLLAPANGTETKDYAQTFWWEPVEDALSYRLQVVTPSFDHTAKLILDTLVFGNRFNYTLDPGDYEWRVRGENGSSATVYASAAFSIYPGSVTTQQVQLQSPANNTLTNQPNALFAWLRLYGADKYRLEIDTNGFADESKLFMDQTTVNLNYAVTFTREKTYQWRVKALNDTAESKWSVVQNVLYDATPPPVVGLNTPLNNASVSKPVTLSWSASATAKKYLLYVYKSDSTSAYNGTFPLSTTSLSYAFNLGVSGEKVYWEVRAVDEAGNTSALGELRSFTIL